MSHDPDSIRFFASAVQSPLASKLASNAAIYDLSALHTALPQVSQQPKSLDSWASDFMQHPLPEVSTEQASVVNSNLPLELDVAAQHSPALMLGMSLGFRFQFRV